MNFQGERRNDCELMANDLLRYSQSPQKSDSVDRLEYSTDQFIDLNAGTILRLAIAQYVDAEEKVRIKWRPADSILLVMPHIAGKVEELIKQGLSDFQIKIAEWRETIKALDGPDKINTFLLNCNRLRLQIAKIEQRVSLTETQLLQLYDENAVYRPLIMIADTTLGWTRKAIDASVTEYSKQFKQQFNSSGKDTKLQLMFIQSFESSGIRKLFRAKYIPYVDILKSAVQMLSDKMFELIRGDPAESRSSSVNDIIANHRSSAHHLVEEFVEKLNKYGRDAFITVHRMDLAESMGD